MLADDRAMVGCIRGDSEEYRSLVWAFVTWCHKKHLKLNIKLTRPGPVQLEGAVVENLVSYKYLELWLDNKLNWPSDTDHLYGEPKADCTS